MHTVCVKKFCNFKVKMKSNVITKTSFYCLITSITWFLYKLVIDIKYIEYVNQKATKTDILESLINLTDNISKLDLKYILQWTSPKTVPFVYMGVGQQGFVTRNCTYINCFVTADPLYLSDVTKFDAIVFAGPEARFLHLKGHGDLPNKRSLHQKFVYASIESADYYPVCSHNYDGFYNWTLTYRLDSDAMWGYMAIRDLEKKVIGPKRIMHWMKLEDMEPVSEEIKKKLKSKKKAVAWFVSNCDTRSGREVFVHSLNMCLKKYNLTIDIYGKCSMKTCHKEKDNCSKMIEDDYYFYLSFENSFAEDYVTEKILHGLKNYAIPIVYGGANYTRFMPDGIYLNARELGPATLAGKINELIKNPDLYAEYFKWKKYYSYHYRFESVETDDYCAFCALLNNENSVKRTTVYNNFRHWWDPPNRCTY